MTQLDDSGRVLTPSAVKHYLQQRGAAPLSDVIHRFDAHPAAVASILEFWQERGCVRRIAVAPASNACGTGCSGCGTDSGADDGCRTDSAFNDLFEWIVASGAPMMFDALTDYEQSWKPAPAHGKKRP